MFPPLEEGILENNPKFAKLYRVLTTEILNEDGTLRNGEAAKERAAVKEELDQHRLQSAQQDLLLHALKTAVPSQTSTDASLLDLLTILPPLLEAPRSRSLSPEDLDLVLSSPPLSDLEHHLPDLAALVSSNLHASALSLARIAHPTTNPSFLHRHIASLPQYVSDLQDDIAAADQTLFESRTETLASLAALSYSHTNELTDLMNALELKHGPIAQNLELHAEDVSLQAQHTAVDAKKTLTTLQDEMYSPDIVAAMQNYLAHLKDAKVRMAEKVRSQQAQLAEYGVGDETPAGRAKEKTMRELARVYREMQQQMEDVKRDLERLERRK